MSRLTNKKLDRLIDLHQDKYIENVIDYNVSLAVKELKEYRDLEEQGLLLKLPCKLGTIVFQIENIIECKFNYSEGCPLEWLHCGSEEDEFMSCDYQYRKLIPVTRRFSLDMLDKFGKTVFLTKEEAEQELKRLENE